MKCRSRGLTIAQATATRSANTNEYREMPQPNHLQVLNAHKSKAMQGVQNRAYSKCAGKMKDYIVRTGKEFIQE